VEAPDNTQFNIIITVITEHSRSGVGVAYNFGLVCLSVCMSVCETIIFECLARMKFILAHAIYLQEIRISFVYEGHQVKITGAKKVKKSCSRNVKLRLAITPVL